MVKFCRLVSFCSLSLRQYKLYLLYLIVFFVVFFLGYYSSYIKLSDNSVKISEISQYISGFEKVKNKQKYRMGYPLVGPIRGYFTEDGYVLDDRYPKSI